VDSVEGTQQFKELLLSFEDGWGKGIERLVKFRVKGDQPGKLAVRNYECS